MRGEPEPDSVAVHGYIALLDATIKRMAESTHAEDAPPVIDED